MFEDPKYVLVVVILLLGAVLFYLNVLLPLSQPQETGETPGEFGKGFCNNVAGVCESLLLNDLDCYSLIVSSIASAGDLGIESCESLEPFYRDKCYASIAKENVLSLPSRAEALCSRIDDEARKAYCLQDVAIFSYLPEESKSLDTCKKISKASLRDECFFAVAKRASEFGLANAQPICSEISFESMQKSCLAAATAKHDLSQAKAICDSLEDEQEKGGCLAALES